MISFNCRCYFCEQRLYFPTHGICSFCLKRLPQLPLCCPQCGLPAISEREICGRCLLEPPFWQELVAVSDYHMALKKLLIEFKFNRRTELAVILARLFVLRWRQQQRNRLLTKPDLLISVPLHKHRHWRRGFNQTELLTDRISYYLGLRWEPNLLERIRSTPAQQSLTAAERSYNLAQAFSLKGNVKGLNVAVFDDVVTTGSTLEEISRLLLANGAKSVQGWCICRTLLSS